MRRRFARIALALWGALLVYVRLGDPWGDRGMSNVVTGFLLVLLLVVLAVRSVVRARRGRRLATLAGLLAVVALARGLVRVDGFSATLIPELRWRWATVERSSAPVVATRVALLAPSPDDFPGFLGARRDNAVPDARLARDWNASPPKCVWRAPIGAGWSAFAVAGGLAFTLEQDERVQVVSARSAADGALAWRTELEESFAHALGGDGPRATPTVVLGPDGGRVYALGAWGRFVCLDAASGVLVWEHDLAREFGGSRADDEERAQYGRASSALVADELVIVPAGGVAGLVAFDARSGAERWRGPPRNYSYASPAAATLAGIAQVLCVNEDTLSGHALDDGRLLWETPWPGRSSGDASASQPVPLAPDRVFVSKGYGGGALLLALATDASGSLVPRELWRDGRVLRTKMTNVVILRGHAYGLDDGILECVELETGARRWKDGRYGHGQVLLAGELLLVCSEDGAVSLVEPDPERANVVLGSFQALEGKCWAHLALAGGVLYVRNAEECAAWALPVSARR